jgi:enoyl-CoA hydratase/carnithine racemase
VIGEERQGPVLRLALDNPPANALSLEVVETLQAALDAARDDDDTRVIIIAGSGKLFSAGHDLKQMTAHRADADGGRASFEQTFAACATLMQGIVEHPKPIIAEVDGVATAAGCQLVATCDLAIASDRSQFAVNGINVGLFCTTPAVALTRNIGAKRAMQMLLTGEMIDAATAFEFGLVNRVVPPDYLPDEVAKVAATISSKSPQAIRLGKQAVRRQVGLSLSQAYETASRTMVENLLASDADEGISAFFEKRAPDFN